MSFIRVEGQVIKGHGVASGIGNDPRYPNGTLVLQQPYFAARGLDLSPYHPGTLNISIAPLRYEITTPRYTFRQVPWSPYIPPEDFSFCSCKVHTQSSGASEGWVYYPHPDTKPEHFQDPHVIEVITRYLDGVRYGDRLVLELDEAQINVRLA